MKVILISNNADLQRELMNTERFKEVSTYHSFKKTYDADVVIFSDDVVDANEIAADYQPTNEQKTFYIVSSKTSEHILRQIETIGLANDVQTIPPGLTTLQITERISQYIFPDVFEQNQNVFTFYGSDHKVGTTMVSQSVAQYLSQKSNKSIAYISLNTGHSYFYEQENKGIEQIRIQLANKDLREDELLKACIKQDNLFILPGPNKLLHTRYIHPEHVENLIILLSKIMDVVIIDAGSNLGDLESGMQLSALQSTTNRFLVTTANHSSKELFDKVNEQIFSIVGIDHTSLFIIINKFFNSYSILPVKDIASLYGMNLAAVIPDVSVDDMSPIRAEYEKKTLLDYEMDEFIESIKTISRIVASKAYFVLEEEEKTKKNKFFKIFSL